MQKYYSIGILTVFLFVMPGAYAQDSALVSVDAVVEQRYTQTVPVLGRLIAKRASTIASRISGPLTEILVEIGDRVRENQTLARVNTDILALRKHHTESQLVESQTRLKTARAQLALAAQDVKRLQGLTNSAAVSKAVYDDARLQQSIAFARVSEAEASINSSQASLEIAELQLSYTEILAPYDGTITEKLTDVGNYLQPGHAVFRLISDRQLELEADIPASLLDGLNTDADVEVVLQNGSRHVARLRAIIPEENPRTRTRRTRFTTQLGADAGILASEQSATIHLPASEARNLLTVHKDGIIRRGQNNIVYLAKDNVAEMVMIAVGDSVGNRIEVLDGIVAGDLVVIRGNERLTPGQPLQVSNP